MEKLNKFKLYFKKAVYLTLALTLTFILFKSGVVYIKLKEYSVTIGIDLERKAPFLPDGLNESIRDSEEAIREADLIIEDARARGILVD